MMKKCIVLMLSMFVVSAYVFSQVSVLTNRNNNKRDAWNKNETILNASNVNPNEFGLLYKLNVDDQIYAQPLVVSNLEINGLNHNSVIFVATVNNTVYAFDAENSNHSTVPIWSINLTNINSKPPTVRDIKPEDCGYDSINNPFIYTDFSNNIGIVGTPVIDTSNFTLYVVSRDVDTTQSPCRFSQWLNAIDIRTGTIINNVYISAFYSGSGDGNLNDTIWFDALRELQRPGLMLFENNIFICWAGHCDWNPYHGWILGYDKTTLNQTVKWNSSPDGERAGIWMSACGPTVDDDGNIYITTGNGTIGSYNTGLDTGNVNWYRNRGESVVKLKIVADTMEVLDWYTPPKCRLEIMENSDLDYGISGALIIPNTNLILSGSKEGIIYVNNINNMGGCDSVHCSLDSANGVIQILQPNHDTSVPLIYGTPIYYKYTTSTGIDSEFVYLWVRKDSMTQYTFNRQTELFDTVNIKKSYKARFYPSILSLSSNENQEGSGIVWGSHLKVSGESANSQSFSGALNGTVKYHSGMLEAFDARDVGRLLWNSEMDLSGRDSVGNYAKFNTPTVVNGKVYLATSSGTVNVYGLFNSWVGFNYDKNIINNFEIYPNPTKENININFTFDNKNFPEIYINIYDMYGKIIYKKITNNFENNIDISKYNNGVYQVSVVFNKKIIRNSKFIKIN